jgi:hypothetical protein
MRRTMTLGPAMNAARHISCPSVSSKGPRSVSTNKEAGVVALDQIEQWRAQLKDEPASFARDLAHVLLLEMERLHAAELACERRFAGQQAAAIRARLATTECTTCGDVALRRMEEEIRIVRPRSDQQPDGTRTTIVTPVPARPRYS